MGKLVMNYFKIAMLALLAMFLVPAEASARFAGAQHIAVPVQQEKILLGFGNPKGFGSFGFQKAPKFSKFNKFSYHKPKFPKGPKAPKHVSGAKSHNHWGGAYVAGALLCTVAWPMINAAMGNPEPTSEEMLRHTIGCFVPPLGVVFFLQDQGAL